VAAATRDEAERLTGPLHIFRLQLASGQSLNLATAEAAEEYARQAGASGHTIEERHPHVVKGTAEDVRDQLDALSRRYGIDEFVIDSPLQHYPARLRSVELLGSTIEPAYA
jgi:alkanesulfonate monooxygenase SsuD/methylene tetrahydromethanopterin reductase-like flavin-dependent oxidoreductase (luciferase family)